MQIQRGCLLQHELDPSLGPADYISAGCKGRSGTQFTQTSELSCLNPQAEPTSHLRAVIEKVNLMYIKGTKALPTNFRIFRAAHNLSLEVNQAKVLQKEVGNRIIQGPDRG